MRLARLVWTGIVLVALGACGRSPLSREAPLLVQVIDRAGEPVADVDVDLWEGDTQLTTADPTDEYGITSLPFPGQGEFVFKAQTIFRYVGPCPLTGSAEVVLVDASEVVVVEVETIPC